MSVNVSLTDPSSEVVLVYTCEYGTAVVLGVTGGHPEVDELIEHAASEILRSFAVSLGSAESHHVIVDQVNSTVRSVRDIRVINTEVTS